MIETGINPSMMMEIASAEGRVPATGQGNTTLIPTTADLFLTAAEAAKLARIHPGTLLKWAREGKVPHRRLSARKVVFPLSKLNNWLAA